MPCVKNKLPTPSHKMFQNILRQAVDVILGDFYALFTLIIYAICLKFQSHWNIRTYWQFLRNFHTSNYGSVHCDKQFEKLGKWLYYFCLIGKDSCPNSTVKEHWGLLFKTYKVFNKFGFSNVWTIDSLNRNLNIFPKTCIAGNRKFCFIHLPQSQNNCTKIHILYVHGKPCCRYLLKC